MAATSLESITWHGECLVTSPPPEDKAALARIKAHWGYIPEFAGAMTQVPWFFDIMMQDAQTCYLSPKMTDLVSLVVSQDSSCRYCYGLSRSLLKLAGMSETQIRALEADFFSSDLPIAERKALDFARKLVRANPRPATQDFEELSQHGWQKPAILEIGAVAAGSILTNRLATSIAAQPAPLEGMAKSWYTPLVKLMYAWFMEPKRKPVKPLPPNPDIAMRPFGPILAALDTLPSGQLFARLIDGVFTSTILPLRTKLLIWSVIGRTVGCDACVTEPKRLAPEANLAPGTIDETVERLTAKDLTPVEALLVPAARDSVRSPPEIVQRRMAGIRAQLSIPETMEFVATAGIANAISRLSAVLAYC